MKFTYSTMSLLAYYFAFAHASPLPDNPLTGPDQPDYSLEPFGTNGVTPIGIPVIEQGAPSCWSKPLDPISGKIKNGGTCRVCVISNATGEEPNNVPFYELWVRDDKNHAIGDTEPFTIAPSPGPIDAYAHQPTGQSFPVGAASLNVWSSLPDDKYAVVYMVWDKPAGWDGPETMRFDTGSEQKIAANNCTSTFFQPVSATTFFTCQFNCGTIGHRL